MGKPPTIALDTHRPRRELEHPSMFAIIEESGSQRKVFEGDQILIDLFEGGQAKAGQTITFDKVLAVGTPGAEGKIGQPYVKGARVAVEVVEPEVKGDKVHIYKFRPKKTERRHTGHRQRYTLVKVKSIQG
jgi:large subunit ribosomal protein L21